MINKNLLREFPNKRVRAIDGMAVTADVWEDAHEYHRQAQRFHNLFSHGSGIVAGLEVIASDPADTSVYILPGLAIDTAGRVIAITEPTAYDVGRQLEGMLYIVLTYGESRPRSDGAQSTQEGAPLYVHAEFTLQAVAAPPHAPYVELARVRRQGRTSAITDARNPADPGPNEIDLRWRARNRASVPDQLGVAVFYAGMTDRRHGSGLSNLARTVSHTGHLNVVVDDNAALTGNLSEYGLVCLVAQRAFQLSPDEQAAVQAYVQGGGTVFLESCRRDSSGAAPGSDQSFNELAGALGVKIADVVKTSHALLRAPNFFAALPAGYDGPPALSAGGGVIVSLADYGCLWNGEKRGGPASRDDLRSAFELGENILHYAAARRKAAPGG